MADFTQYPHGKDQEYTPGIEFNETYYPTLNIIIALAKALVKKGILTKTEILDEL